MLSVGNGVLRNDGESDGRGASETRLLSSFVKLSDFAVSDGVTYGASIDTVLSNSGALPSSLLLIMSTTGTTTSRTAIVSSPTANIRRLRRLPVTGVSGCVSCLDRCCFSISVCARHTLTVESGPQPSDDFAVLLVLLLLSTEAIVFDALHNGR